MARPNLLDGFKANPILGPLAEDLKSQYLEGIEAEVLKAGGRQLRYTKGRYGAIAVSHDRLLSTQAV